MALSVRQQITYWGIAILLFLTILWFLGDVLLPFIVGGAMAYFMDPVADRLQRAGFSRMWATITISAAAVLVFVLTALLIIPTMVNQLTSLIEIAPELFSRLQTSLTERFPQLIDAESPVRQALTSLGETIRSRGGELANQVLNSALGVVNILVFVVVAPVVAFYLLLDWDNMVAKIDELLPRDHQPVIRNLASQINQTLASFVRGQGTVCVVLGTYYAVGLMLAGLQFGLIVGFIAGLLSFIPYIGALIGGVLAIGLALYQFWGEWVWIAVVAGIFMTGQVLEGNVLTPKLVGGSVGLHPVWLIFALSAFGSLFGFVGMLVAVPVSAIIGVLVRFGLAQYRGSLLFRGLGQDSEDD
jgi:predicted PurR-regulated permease PerM